MTGTPHPLCYIAGRRLGLALIRFLRRVKPSAGGGTDEELLSLFRSDPDRAWDLFIDRYADVILSCLDRLGFDHDQAMDRFVYVCEKLAEADYRRLRTIRFAGRDGELTPWVRTVVKNLSISWAWSVDGRRRLFRSIEELPERERRVFELYFWQGLSPWEVHERLRHEERGDLAYAEVLDALDVVFAHLTANQRWRLMSRLARTRAVSIDEPDPETGLTLEPKDGEADPERDLMDRERRRLMAAAVADLAPRDRLILQLRYDDALSLAEVAEIVSLSLSTVKSSIRSSLDRLRETLREASSP